MAALATDIILSSSSVISSNNSNRIPSRKSQTNRTQKDFRSPSKSSMLNESLVDSFLVSSTSNVNSSSIIVTRQETGKSISAPKKRYVSSFKTLVNATNDRHTQRLNYVGDSVMILKLSKEKNEDSESSGKFRSNVTSNSAKSAINPTPDPRLTPLIKTEIQRRRTAHHDSSAANNQTDFILSTNPNSQISIHSSTSNQISPNVLTRQRTNLDSSMSNGNFFSNDRNKSNFGNVLRTSRSNFNNSNNLSINFVSTPQNQRSNGPPAPPTATVPLLNGKSRFQLLNREQFDYPDPFTNCPHELMNRLSQLTKFQLETIDWEKKRRFIKKKTNTQNPNQGKETP